jgi:heat shock protein HslJ
VTFRRSLALLTLSTLVLVSCANADDGSGSTGTDPEALIGHGWILDQASMAALIEDVPSGATVTLTFEDGQASGRAACNSYGGAYDAGDDGSLSFEGFAVTEMACEPELMSLESAYLEALGTLTGFRVDRQLTLHGDGMDLTFDEEVPPVALPLVATTWTLTTIASGDAVSTVLNGTVVTAELTADGTVSGSAGCNRYSGSYTWTGDSSRSPPSPRPRWRAPTTSWRKRARSSRRWSRWRRSPSMANSSASPTARARCCWGSTARPSERQSSGDMSQTGSPWRTPSSAAAFASKRITLIHPHASSMTACSPIATSA